MQPQPPPQMPQAAAPHGAPLPVMPVLGSDSDDDKPNFDLGLADMLAAADAHAGAGQQPAHAAPLLGAWGQQLGGADAVLGAPQPTAPAWLTGSGAAGAGAAGGLAAAAPAAALVLPPAAPPVAGPAAFGGLGEPRLAARAAVVDGAAPAAASAAPVDEESEDDESEEEEEEEAAAAAPSAAAVATAVAAVTYGNLTAMLREATAAVEESFAYQLAAVPTSQRTTYKPAQRICGAERTAFDAALRTVLTAVAPRAVAAGLVSDSETLQTKLRGRARDTPRYHALMGRTTVHTVDAAARAARKAARKAARAGGGAAGGGAAGGGAAGGARGEAAPVTDAEIAAMQGADLFAFGVHGKFNGVGAVGDSRLMEVVYCADGLESKPVLVTADVARAALKAGALPPPPGCPLERGYAQQRTSAGTCCGVLADEVLCRTPAGAPAQGGRKQVKVDDQLRCGLCNEKLTWCLDASRPAAAAGKGLRAGERRLVVVNALEYAVSESAAGVHAAYADADLGTCAACNSALGWHRNRLRCAGCHAEDWRATTRAAAAHATAAAAGGAAPPPPRPEVLLPSVPVSQRLTVFRATPAEEASCAAYLAAEAAAMDEAAEADGGDALDGLRLPRTYAVRLPDDAVCTALGSLDGADAAVVAFRRDALGLVDDPPGGVRPCRSVGTYLPRLARALPAGALLNSALRGALVAHAHAAAVAEPRALHEVEHDLLQLLNAGASLRGVPPPRSRRDGVAVVTRSPLLLLAAAAELARAGNGTCAMVGVLVALAELFPTRGQLADALQRLLGRLHEGTASLELQVWSAVLLALATAPSQAGLPLRQPRAHLVDAVKLSVCVLGSRKKSAASMLTSLFKGESISLVSMSKLWAQRRSYLSKEALVLCEKLYTSNKWSINGLSVPARRTLAQLARDAAGYADRVGESLECVGGLTIVLGLLDLVDAIVTQLENVDPALAAHARTALAAREAADVAGVAAQTAAVKALVNSVAKIVFLHWRIVSPRACCARCVCCRHSWG